MTQRNLEQIRAKHAHAFWAAQRGDTAGEEGGDVVNGLPALILNNGLLGTLAFAKAKGKGYENFLRTIGVYLATSAPEGPGVLKGVRDLDTFITVLANGDSAVLRLATAEALAFLSYLKRFAPQKESTP